MKKILITLRDITETGGGERVCANLSNALSEFYEIKIISFHKKENHITYDLNPNIQVEYLSCGEQRAENLFKRFFNKTILRVILSLKASARIKRYNPDIVFCNDGTFMPIVKTNGIRYMRLWHLIAPRKRKKVFGRYDMLVVLSDKQIDIWKKYHTNIRVIPNFTLKKAQGNTDYSQKVVLSVGRIDNGDQKGFFRLVEIWKMVMDDPTLSEWKLRIVGSGPQKDTLEEKIKQLNLADSIEIKPYTNTIEEEYMQSSIYAMSSRFEGFPMVLLESALYGLPAISFDINTGPSDIISNGENGFLMDDNDVENFAEKLKCLMHDENKRCQMGKKAKEIVSGNFSKEAIIAKWLNLFDELLQH